MAGPKNQTSDLLNTSWMGHPTDVVDPAVLGQKSCVCGQIFRSKLTPGLLQYIHANFEPEDHWSCVAHLSAAGMLN